jgi:hypothetical protein
VENVCSYYQIDREKLTNVKSGARNFPKKVSFGITAIAASNRVC